MPRIFFAGGENMPEAIFASGCRRLVNYFYMKGKSNIKDFKNKYKCKELFLDSGSFTTWTKGVKITCEEYAAFVKQFNCDYYSVLDVIGDAQKTLENQHKLENLGIKPIPCFHYGDDFIYLDKYVLMYEFISLGGMVGKSSVILQPWLDKIFLKYPKHKFHGFGIMRGDFIKKYPWYSIDSSTWIKNSLTKRIYFKEMGTIYLGENESKYKLILKNNPKLRARIESLGINADGLFNNYIDICRCNIKGGEELESQQLTNNIAKQRQLYA